MAETSFDAVAGSLNSNIGQYVLLATLTNASTNYPLADNIANYKALVSVITIQSSAALYFVASTITPVSVLNIGNRITIEQYDGATLRYCTYALVSETQVQTLESNNFKNITSCLVFGVK